MSGRRKDLSLQARRFPSASCVEKFVQGFHIQSNSFVFHVDQHRNQRALDVIADLAAIALFFNVRANRSGNLQGDIRIFAGILGDLLDRYVAHVALVRPSLADQIAGGNRPIAQIELGQVIQPVPHLGLLHGMGQHRVHQRPLHLHVRAT